MLTTYPYAAGKVLHLLYEKEMTYLATPFYKAGYRQCPMPDSTQVSAILMMVLEAVV